MTVAAAKKICPRRGQELQAAKRLSIVPWLSAPLPGSPSPAPRSNQLTGFVFSGFAAIQHLRRNLPRGEPSSFRFALTEISRFAPFP